MKYIAAKDKDTFLFELSKQEVGIICFGDKHAFLRGKPDAGFINRVRQGEIQEISISTRFNSVVSFINSNIDGDEYNSIIGKLETLTRNLKNAAKYQKKIKEDIE